MKTHRARRALTAALGIAALAAAGCAASAPPEAAVPMTPGSNYVPHDAAPKPLPDSALNPPGMSSPGPYEDEPILDQRLPEEAYFVSAYNKVHQPRLAIYVNRTLTGQIIPPNPGGPTQTVQHTQESTGGVTVSNGSFNEHDDAYGRDVQDGHSNFATTGPAQYTETTTTYQAPSDSDEAALSTLDYQAMEKILADWLSCGGQVRIISSDYLAAQLSPQDMQDLSQGRPVAMGDLAQKVGADILIQVQAHPTHQTNGLQVRLVAEAMNVRGGDQIGSAVVDVPLPLEKTQINQFTRFIAAKLMVGMAGAWNSYIANPPPPPPGQEPPPPPTPGSGNLPPVPPAASTPPTTQPLDLIP
ncbi:MAG: hypothetical protein ABSH22_14995 [Tepidisphaeraceae bacterium]|jgi:hypothetical protein